MRLFGHRSHDAVVTGAVTQPVLQGVLAEFSDADTLLDACRKVRDAGYRKWDAHSPYPIHGIERAMGMPTTKMPYLIIACGIIGCLTGIGLTWWTNASNPKDFLFFSHIGWNNLLGYDYIISGKPAWSLPANIPVIFELTVLFSAFGAVFGMLGLNGLPKLYNWLNKSARFRRATNDRFYIHIDATDPKFREGDATQLCEGAGATIVERIEDTNEPLRLPTWIVTAMTIATCFALIPPALAARSWYARSTEPRYHIVQDMDNQERYKAQQANPLFDTTDGRADRPTVAGTVARGDSKLLGQNRQWFEGKVGDAWAAAFPETRGDGSKFEINEDVLNRGEARFNIYCLPCHGMTGAGDGMVQRHVQRIIDRGGTNTNGWVQPKSLHDQAVIDRPVGHIFNTITNGLNTMPAYGTQIPEADRWAIIAYVRALQRSEVAKLADLTPEQQQKLQAEAKPKPTTTSSPSSKPAEKK